MVLRGLLAILTLILTVCLVTISGCKPSSSREVLRIAAASNQAVVLREIVDRWEEKTGHKADLITGSSGRLTAQISEGAPFDVFLAADHIYTDRLLDDGHILDSISTYAFGKLALIGRNIQGDISEIISTSTRLAIANPEIAPYGKASIVYLDGLALSEDWTSKLAYAENVAQVHQSVYTGAAEIGITALGLLKHSSDEDVLKWKAIDGSYKPVEQLLAIVKSSHLVQVSSSFRSFLLSSEGRAILSSYGYDTTSAR